MWKFNHRHRIGARRVLALAVAAAASGLGALPNAAFAADAWVVVADAEKPTGQGTVNSVDAARRKINITHGPIAALKWPGMTMDFAIAPGLDVQALKLGTKIVFTLSRSGDGVYVVDAIKPAE